MFRRDMKVIHLATVLLITGCNDPINSLKPESEILVLPDGTQSIDSRQGGAFEITILPIDQKHVGESNPHAMLSDKIELIVDGTKRIVVSSEKVIRIQNLSPKKHSLVEYVKGSRVSCFSVDGSKSKRQVADYNETYGTWMVRDPLR